MRELMVILYFTSMGGVLGVIWEVTCLDGRRYSLTTSRSRQRMNPERARVLGHLAIAIFVVTSIWRVFNA